MSHLSPEQLSAHLDHALAGGDREKVAAHLAACERCRTELDALAGQDRALASALEHDPGEEYFEGFATRIEERLRSASPARTAAGGAERRWPGGWFGSPRRLALAGVAAAVLVGGGVTIVLMRQSELPQLADRKLLERAQARENLTPPGPRGDALESGNPPGAENPVAAGEQVRAPKSTVPPPPARPAPRQKRAAPEDLETGSDAAKSLEARERAERNADPSAAQESETGHKPDRAGPGRAYEVRRDPVTGEEMPLRREDRLPRASAPAAPAPAPASEGPVRVITRRVAEPMGVAPSGPAAAPTRGALAPAGEPAPVPVHAEKPQGTLDRLDAAPGLLCGVVRDPGGRPVAGAQVVVADLGLATRSDASGHFCIRAPLGERTISVMAVGFEPARRPVAVIDDPAELALVLKPVAVLEVGRTLRVSQDSAGGASALHVRGGESATWGTPGTYSYTTPPAQGTKLGDLRSEFRKEDEPADVFAALPDTLRVIARDAERTTVTAARGNSAGQFDVAADQWARLLRGLHGGPAEPEVRFRLGEARFHAWESAPSSRRAAAAIEALTTFVARAPAGERRQQAARWLDRVRP